MRLIGLVSGGKDSIFNLMESMSMGHEIVCIGYLEPIEHKE